MNERTSLAAPKHRRADAETAPQNGDERTAAALAPARARLNAFLVRFQETVRDTLDSTAVAATACRLLTEELGVDRAYWSEVDWTTREFVIGADYTASDAEPIRGRFPLDGWEPFSSYHLDGRSVVVNDTATDPRVTPDLRRGYEALGVQADLAVPVLAGNKLRSILAVNQGHPREWSCDEVALVKSAADWCWSGVERARAEAAVRDSEDRQAFLLNLSDAVRPLMGAAEIQAETTRLLREQLKAAWCYYVDWDLERKIGLVLRDSVREGLSSLAGAHDVSDAPEFLHLLAGGAVLTVRDYASYEHLSTRIRRKFTALGFRSMMTAPLVKGGRLIASLLVGDTEVRDWSAAETSLLVEVAERTWAAVERARAEDELRESERMLAADLADAEQLRTLAERLVSEERFKTVYDEILVATVAITHADAGTIQIYDPALNALELIASLNFSQTLEDHFRFVDTGSGTACGLALKTGARAFVDFPEQMTDPGCRLLVGEGIQSAVAQPLVSRTGAPLGMLNAHWRTPRHRLSERETRFLGLLARQAADLIEQRRAQNALRESEERLRVLIEGVPQLVWRAVESGHWTWASPQWTAYTGQDEPDSHAWGWLDPLHMDDRETARVAWGRAAEAGIYEADYRLYHAPEQRYRWFQSRAAPVRNEAGQITEWLGTSTDVDDLRTMQARQEVLVNELQHRARNLLGVVSALADRTVKRGGSVEAFEERLQALSRAQGLLSKGGSDTVEIGMLLRAELAVHEDTAAGRITIAGPEVHLRARQVQNFALAVHELTTNAVKYGALKTEAGRLAASWEIILDKRERRRLALTWVETGVTIETEKVTRRGYGTEMIQEALAYALEAEVDYELGRDGVRCRIEMPIP